MSCRGLRAACGGRDRTAWRACPASRPSCGWRRSRGEDGSRASRLTRPSRRPHCCCSFRPMTAAVVAADEAFAGPAEPRQPGVAARRRGRSRASRLRTRRCARRRKRSASRATDVRVIGRLTPLHIPVSGFVLHPVVGVALTRPVMRPEPGEVERVIEAPVGRLARPAASPSREPRPGRLRVRDAVLRPRRRAGLGRDGDGARRVRGGPGRDGQAGTGLRDAPVRVAGALPICAQAGQAKFSRAQMGTARTGPAAAGLQR